MKIIYPSGEKGFVEYKRAFRVEGSFDVDKIPDDALLSVTLKNSSGKTVREVCTEKNAKQEVYYPEIVAYSEKKDSGRIKMAEYGFPEAVVDLSGNIKNATVKAWFSKKEFRATVISASNIESGALFDDGMDFRSEKGEAYSLLPMGEYTLEVTLSAEGKVLESTEKKIEIGRRENQLICRFHPTEHKEKIIKWSHSMGYSSIDEPLPGYLNPYLGDWEYHMGLLKMYRANDLPLFETAKVRMFVYMIDKESTSYETELAYLQSVGAVGDKERFFAYHYDIGEAKIGEREAKIVEFPKNEYMALCRVDSVKNAENGVFNINFENVTNSQFDFDNITVSHGEKYAVMGVIKPWQGDKNGFILRDDNTYEVLSYPERIRYTLTDGKKERTFEFPAGLRRIYGEKSDGSVYEFYNALPFDEFPEGTRLNVKVECLDRDNKKAPAQSAFVVKII